MAGGAWRWLAVLLACAGPASAAEPGFRALQVPASADLPAMRGGVWYPTFEMARPDRLGPYPVQIARDAELAKDGPFPLVLISHGTGGSHAGHHDTAEALARAGFIAASISHPGDNVQDDSAWGTSAQFTGRARHMRRLLDAFLSGEIEGWAGTVDARRIGMFGFSAGGTTTLLLTGGMADFGRVPAFCEARPADPLCGLMRWAQALREVRPEPMRDERIRAAAVAAPALGFVFGGEGMRAVPSTLPMQIWRASRDELLIEPHHAEAVRDALPARPDYRVVPGAGHYAFLAPCPPPMALAAPEICADAPGFDRAEFHAGFNAALVAFFRHALAP